MTQCPPGRDLQRKAPQPGQHPLLGARKVQAELRVAMQRAAKTRQFALQGAPLAHQTAAQQNPLAARGQRRQAP